MLKLPIPDRERINLRLPTFTLDVNQMAARSPNLRTPDRYGLGCLEYQYFEAETVELCVTPETTRELARHAAVNSIGSLAYTRIQRAQFFKARPASTMLDLDAQEADRLWLDVRNCLWPASRGTFTEQQNSDVTQIFFHVVCSSMVVNAAYVTLDHHMLNARDDLAKRYGIVVQTPNEAWEYAHRRYGLLEPTSYDLDATWNRQAEIIAEIARSA